MKVPKKFGLSLEDKNKKLLDWFEKKHDVHSIKEVEVKASKETGISSMQIKDILQNLIDENLINSEKCGTLKLHTEISITSPEIIKEIRLYLSEIETDNKKTTNNEKKEVHSSNDSEESGDSEKSGDSDDSDKFDEDLCKQEYEPSLKLNRELLIAQLKKVEDEYILLEKNLKRINMKSPKYINEIKDKITFVNDMTEIITGKTNFFLFSYLKDSFLLTFSKR
ncbi:unnamed protein product [[Candida] boidinii]|nr:unnamed protein product [[Candida] boidinii]